MFLIKHPDPKLNIPWYLTQISFLLLPINPLWGMLVICTATIIIFRLKYRVIISQHINWGFAILGGSLTMTSLFAFDRVSAISGLINFLPYFIIFAGLSQLLYSVSTLEQLARIIYFGSVPITVLGFGQIWWGLQGEIQNILMPGWYLRAMGNPYGRMSSLFYHANFLASFLTIIWVLGLGLIILELRKSNTDKKFFYLSLLLVINSLTFIALILTHSRNGWMTTLVTCLAFAIYLGWRWILLTVAIVSGAIIIAAFGNPPVRDWFRLIVPMFIWARINDQFYPNRDVETLRITLWKFSWHLALKSPWKGWGLGSFKHLYQPQSQIVIGHSHNLTLMLLSEVGIPWTVFFYFLVGWILAKGIILLTKINLDNSEEKLIIFTYLTAFFACILFHVFDVTIFDERVNLISWSILSAIHGLTNNKKRKYFT